MDLTQAQLVRYMRQFPGYMVAGAIQNMCTCCFTRRFHFTYECTGAPDTVEPAPVRTPTFCKLCHQNGHTRDRCNLRCLECDPDRIKVHRRDHCFQRSPDLRAKFYQRVRCYNCQELGHTQSVCPYAAPQ